MDTAMQDEPRPLVSVIIIFLNAEGFIQEAIESVFAQVYDTWELLLVDDGSSDGSPDIARVVVEQHPGKVRYLDHPGHQNRGMSASRNLGIANAQGEYIAFLDADDVWLPDKLKKQVAILESQPEAGMLYGLSQWWYSWTGNPEDSQRDFIHELGVPPDTLIQPPTLLTLFFLSQQAAIPNPSNILVRREIFDKVGGFEEILRGMYEDQAFYAKVCLVTPVFASRECWDRYRQHPDSSSANTLRKGEEFTTRLFFLNWLAAYMDSQGIEGTETRRLLRKEIWIYRYPFLYLLFRSWQPEVRRLITLLAQKARRTIPAPVRSRLMARWRNQDYCPPIGWAHLGNLRRLTPFSREFGYDRGLPIDRYYIDKFLSDYQTDIRGHVLEIADNAYTHRFGGKHVTKSDVLHVVPGNPKATIVGDLTRANHIPSDTFDCIILTQTLQFIYEVREALKTLYRITKPGGVVLATIPGISPVSRYDMERWGHYWGFTTLSVRRLFEGVFPADHVQTETFGNVLTATAFLYGMAAEELKQLEIEFFDPDYEVIIAVRAVKPEA
jgi:glycosyltransferase involved in cell wall biosynthesis